MSSMRPRDEFVKFDDEYQHERTEQMELHNIHIENTFISNGIYIKEPIIWRLKSPYVDYRQCLR